MRSLLRALVWLGASAGLLLVGFALFGTAVLAPSVIARGELPGRIQREALGAVYSALALQALLPELVLTLATWLVVARLAPALDHSRRALALALAAVGALWFPAVGHYLFTAWSPTGPGAYLITLLLVAGGAALALWVPRLASPALAPGCFTATPKRGIVDAR
ncbi:MAG TPA: hypothetical protein VKF60_00015 [Myxococcota bacterium]|nr:hypothetical protein [Myxococcota bacterium]